MTAVLTPCAHLDARGQVVSGYAVVLLDEHGRIRTIVRPDRDAARRTRDRILRRRNRDN